MMSALLYQCCRLSFAILYPTYSSFKAVRGKNVREYVKWMMYWIVFALFSFIEVFADILISWFPFYYILKLCFIMWLVLPATKGSSLLYRKVVHPQLINREKEIDEYVEKAKDQSCTALIALGSRGFTFATNLILSTAAKGQSRIADTLHQRSMSLSMSDLSSDTGFGSRSVSMLSLASDDSFDETDAQRLSRDKLERELLIAYSRRRPLVRPLDLTHTADEEESEGNVSPQSPYNTRSSQQARRRDDSQTPRLRSAPAHRKTPKSPPSSTASSSFGDEEFETLDVGSPSSAAGSPRTTAATLSRTTSGSSTTSITTPTSTTASWRLRSSYAK